MLGLLRLRKSLALFGDASLWHTKSVIGCCTRVSSVLSTNAMLLNESTLRRMPVDVGLHISLDSGFSDEHAASRILRNGQPSAGSLQRVEHVIRAAIANGNRVRILTCVGPHSCYQLFELGERLAGLGVSEWNISRILPAGRALRNYDECWLINEQRIHEQITAMRKAYGWIRIRFSNRTKQDGYFLLVLPDGTLATQWTDGQDKVLLGRVLDMTLHELQSHPKFDLLGHGRKWLSSIVMSDDLTYDSSD